MIERLQGLLYQDVTVKEIVKDEIRRVQTVITNGYSVDPAYAMKRSLEIVDENGCNREVIFWSSKYETHRLNDAFAFYDWVQKSKTELKGIPIKPGTILKINKFTGSATVKGV